jgi:hypothetical protein
MNTSKLLSLGIVLLGCISAENVAAQAAGAPQAGPQSQSRSAITPAQMLKQANESLEYMQGTKAAIEKRLKKAKSKNDTMLELALNRKLIEISSLIQNAETRKKDLQAAIDRGDMDRANHEFTVLNVYADKAETVNVEVTQLIGNDDGGDGLRSSDDSEEQPVTTNTSMPGGGGGGGGITPPIPEPSASPF